VTLGAVTLAVIGYAVFRLVGELGGRGTVVPRTSTSAVRDTLTPQATPTSPAITTSQPTTPHPEPVPLAAVNAAAFGPQGLADGDNPQIAGRVLTGTALGWQSQWYATPSFGDLKLGTGLLLDLGRSYSVSSVRVTLGSLAGATFQVRLGQRATFSGLPVIATETAATPGDMLTLPLRAPVTARYVLIWFTKLPPDGQGHYQASVRQVAVRGLPVH
jgi:hypothetical protein